MVSGETAWRGHRACASATAAGGLQGLQALSPRRWPPLGAFIKLPALRVVHDCGTTQGGIKVQKQNLVAKNRRLQLYLEDFRTRFEPELESYLSEKLVGLSRINPVGDLITGVIRDFIVRGGKRLRAALVTLGYRAINKEMTSHILRPAISVEMLHSYFLIHDDVIDRSDLRRHQPTVHRVFENRY